MGLATDAAFAMAVNGDLFCDGGRFSGTGTPQWARRYTTAGALAPSNVRTYVQVGSDLVGIMSMIVDQEYRTVVVRTDAAGVPLSAARLVGPTVDLGPTLLAKVVPAPDGGWLVLTEEVYRFAPNGNLMWTKAYADFERPTSVAWTADGGFYGLANGAGILRYTAEGVPVRKLTSFPDYYGGVLATTQRQAPLLHEDKLYFGIGMLFQDGSMLRTNTGVMVTDTMGAVLGHLMNTETLSPADDNTVGVLIGLAIENDRLYASMWQNTQQGQGRNFLLDCALDLTDHRWYQMHAGDGGFVGATFVDPEGRVVLAGGHDGDLFHARFSPGTDLGGCFPSLGYAAAPVDFDAKLLAPGGITSPAVTLEPMTLSVVPHETAMPTLECTSIGVEERDTHGLLWALDPSMRALVVRGLEPADRKQVELLDASGRSVYAALHTTGTLTIDVADLSPGVYVLVVRTDSGVQGVAVLLPR